MLRVLAVCCMLVLAHQQSPRERQITPDYVVVRTHLPPTDPAAAPFLAVADKAAAYHHAATIDFDGHDIAALLAELRARKPTNVLFVLRPEDLDINLHRDIISICNKIDDDIFADFDFGYLTARTPEALAALWDRTVQLHEHGLASHTWAQSSITSGQKSIRYDDGCSGLRKAAGFSGPALYFAEVGSDPDGPAHVPDWLPALNDASVIDITGNADPQGIWLFSGERNRDHSKHWEFSPDKVGQDPDHCMPRITATVFRALHIPGAIVWSGACHTGATHHVYVESDIVSTFGRTEHTTRYDLPLDQSIALALIDAGAVAFLAPVGPNHGYSTINEQEFALEHGASLGEALKSTYDDVFLASNGNPVLARFVDGQPHPDEPQIMQSGGVNRLLIGDPSLRPFKATPRSGEFVTIEHTAATSFDVVIRWDKSFHARSWDMYGADRQHDGRIDARIDLDAIPAPFSLPRRNAAVQHFNATVLSAQCSGAPLAARLAHLAYEDDHGRRLLHVQCNFARKDIPDRDIEVRCTIVATP